MSRRPPSPEEQERRDRILAARPLAARTALRLGARNTVGLTNDDLRSLADEGLVAADAVFDPARGVELATLAYPYVCGAVLHAIRARRRVLAHEVPEDAARAARRAGDRRGLDDLGAGIDPDDVDVWEDTEEDFAREAHALADDGMLAAILERAARGERSPEATVIARELRDRLRTAVDDLPPVEARLIRLRFLEQRTIDETAAAAGMALSTAYDQLARALRALRRRLGITPSP